ncbi:MAG: alanine racemase, partial [Thermosynechococcaceae cyanobacterium]
MKIDSTDRDSLDLDRAWVEIDRAALTHNIRGLQGLLGPHTALMAVVKANAYGHGAVGVAQVAQDLGVQCFGVATLQEGIELRQGGITRPIVLLGAAQSEAQIQAIAQWQLQPTLCTPEQAQRFSERLLA